MATDNIKLNVPFDEPDGSNVAYDYAQNRHDATIEGGSFIPGKQGNCIHFDGSGYAEISSDVIPFSSNFTITAWIRTNQYQDGYTGKKLGVLCNTGVMNGSREIWVDVKTGSWNFVAIRKAGNTVSLFLNGTQMDTVTLPSTLTGLALLQDIYGVEYAVADIDEVKVFGEALTPGDVAEELSSFTKITYSVNGVTFDELDIHVESSSGILDLPKLKAPASIDWADYHGEVVDLSDKRFEAREITLNCWLRAFGKINFAEKVNALYEHFRKDGTARLMIGIHPTKPLVYEVYAADGIAHNKRWHADKMIGTFALKLKEPDPVKRVVRHQRTNASSAEVSLAFKSDKMVTVYWGDGTASEDVYGNCTGDNALKHTYDKDGIYYVIVAGVIEDITDFTTNGIIVWNKL